MSRHLATSIPWAADELEISPSSMRRIVARGEVKVVEVNGLRRIPDAEVERLRQVLGRSEQHAWQRKEQRARQLDQQRLAVEERRKARREWLLQELREMEAAS